jgi:hypothetical protein
MDAGKIACIAWQNDKKPYFELENDGLTRKSVKSRCSEPEVIVRMSIASSFLFMYPTS